MGDLDDQLRRLAERRAAQTPTTSATQAIAARPPADTGRRWWLAAAAMFALLAGGAAWIVAAGGDHAADVAGTTTTIATTTTTPPIPVEDPRQLLEATGFGVAIEAPAEWVEIESDRTWGGESGFVAVDLAPPGSLDESVAAVIAQAEEILGPDPALEPTTVAGRPAVRITGSEPATSDFGTFVHSITVITAPLPVTHNDDTSAHIGIAGDAEHHRQIMDSLTWLGGTPSALAPGADYDLAVASAEGIELRHRTSHEIDRFETLGLTGARLAFVLDGPVLVYEAGLSGVPTMQIVVATPSVHDVALEGNVRLLDAATVDGTPTALVARRTGDTPETADERLILLDLETRAETDLGRFGGWESGVADARFGDGAIALQLSAEGFSWIEVITYAGEQLWSTEEVFDQVGSLALDGRNVFLVNVSPADSGPLVQWQLFDLDSGEFIGEFDREFDPEDGDLIGDGGCVRPEWSAFLWCSSAEGAGPAQLDLELGLIDPVPGIDTGLVTATREVSAVAPESHPCGRSNGSGPHDSLSVTPIELDDGRTMDVVVWNEGDRVFVQGFLPDWSTNRLDVGFYIHEHAQHIAVTSAEEANEGFPTGLGGAFTIFIPDQVFSDATGTGYVTWVDFDGCELTAGVSGIVN